MEVGSVRKSNTQVDDTALGITKVYRFCRMRSGATGDPHFGVNSAFGPIGWPSARTRQLTPYAVRKAWRAGWPVRGRTFLEISRLRLIQGGRFFHAGFAGSTTEVMPQV